MHLKTCTQKEIEQFLYSHSLGKSQKEKSKVQRASLISFHTNIFIFFSIHSMLEGKALIEDTDMPVKMQIQAMSYASQALDLYDVLDCKSIAAHIKKVSPFLYIFSYQSLLTFKLLVRLMKV